MTRTYFNIDRLAASRLAFIALACVVNLAAKPAAVAPSLALTAAQKQKLIALVANNRDAQLLAKSVHDRADKALGDEPGPVREIRSEGLLDSDSQKKATVAALRDMPKLVDLAYAWTLSNDQKYGEQAKKFILAWVTTAEPPGNPIDATRVESLLMAYDLTRAGFSKTEQQQVEQWLRAMAERQIAERKAGSATLFNNWNSHRLKLVGMVAIVLNDKPLMSQVLEGFREQVAGDLYPDGTSFDFHERDALHYHLYTLEPLLSLAMVADRNGIKNLYTYVAPNGASLKKSVDFVVPFAEGKLTHPEFVNSKVKFDRERAAAGQKGYQTGAPFEPHSARDMFALAAYFDPKLSRLAATLAEKSDRELATWQMALNACK
ncbi:MAG: alginate lyase family protein [Planctomycetes bacterium]|nr:alginate lyase family protein [Planctomycetota bacterium]